MDKEKLIEVYSDIVRRRRCSTDDILVRPSLRNEFLANLRSLLGEDVGEEDSLRVLIRLRKRKQLPPGRDLLA